MPSSISSSLQRKIPHWIAGEFAASFIFAVVTAGIVLNSKEEGDIFLLKKALVVIFTATINVVCFGDISGAHFNPAVTLSTVLLGKMCPSLGAKYMLTQVAGFVAGDLAISGAFWASDKERSWTSFMELLRSLLPQYNALDDSVAAGAAVFFAETLMFFVVILVISLLINESSGHGLVDLEVDEAQRDSTGALLEASEASTTPTRNAKVLANPSAFYTPAIIGFVLGTVVLIANNLSAGIVNPALVLAPCILTLSFSGSLAYHFAAVVGCVLSSIVVVRFFKVQRGNFNTNWNSQVSL